MYYYKRDARQKQFLLYAGFVVFVLVVVFVYRSEYFERQEPNIILKDTVVWNLENPVSISISDNFGIKSYRVSLVKEDSQIILLEKRASGEKKIDINVSFPTRTFFPKGDVKLFVEVKDNSYWNFGAGNKKQASADVVLDRQKPVVSIISKSYTINLGGTALVIYKVDDKNLDHTKIITNSDKEFESGIFRKEGYYISLIARDLRTKDFKAYIYAVDKAGNETHKLINMLNKNINYRSSNIGLSDLFLNGKITQLYKENFKEEEPDLLARFSKINEDLRQNAESVVLKHTTNVLETKLNRFDINSFGPLKRYLKVGSFGDHRFFYKNKDLVGQSYHLGIDIANNEHGDIYASNNAKVVYTGNNGVYGKMIVLYHGLGLYSIYGHCSEFSVKNGQIVKKEQIIGKTGRTGLALGDHLHFETRVQGVPVRPAEWLDENWINYNIKRPIEKAIKIMGDD